MGPEGAWRVVRIERSVVVLVVVAAASVVAMASMAVWSASRVGTRTLSVPDLRAGTDFVLAGVAFHQTGFNDSRDVDIGYVVSFRITFPDQAVEDLTYTFDGFCAFGAVNERSTVHRAPSAVFRSVCGEEFVTVTVV